MRVGLVGAGLAGLAAARALQRDGHEVVLWEKREEPGGRVETVNRKGFVFDSGATSIAPRGMAIEAAMLSELPTDQLVRVEKPIYTHEGLRVSAGDVGKNKTARYTYRPGNAHLAKLLSEGLNIRFSTTVDSVTRSGQEYLVEGEACQALILTSPIPLLSPILWSLRESRPTANASYRSCLSVLLGFEQPVPETSYHALLDVEQRHPLTWLSLESAKCPGRAPDGCSAFVAQMSPAYSLIHYAHPDQVVIDDTVGYLQRLYGEQFNKPVVAEVRRWKYSLPDSVASFETVNHPGMRILLAGDGLMAGRSEAAFETGVKAAQMLIDL